MIGPMVWPRLRCEEDGPSARGRGSAPIGSQRPKCFFQSATRSALGGFTIGDSSRLHGSVVQICAFAPPSETCGSDLARRIAVTTRAGPAVDLRKRWWRMGIDNRRRLHRNRGPSLVRGATWRYLRAANPAGGIGVTREEGAGKACSNSHRRSAIEDAQPSSQYQA